WRVAHDQSAATRRKQVGLQQRNNVAHAQQCDVLASTSQRARVLVGGDDLAHSAVGQHGGQDTAAGSDIEGEVVWGQGSTCDKVYVLTAIGREHAIVHMNAAVQRRNG